VGRLSRPTIQTLSSLFDVSVAAVAPRKIAVADRSNVRWWLVVSEINSRFGCGCSVFQKLIGGAIVQAFFVRG